MKNFYIITYSENGEEKTIETLKERIKCYKRNNIKIKNVLKKVILINYVSIKF